MTQEHPITPPDYLVKQWSSMNWQQGSQAAFADAARWGADQELEACCEWISMHTTWDANRLRDARRPKPPSLKAQALRELQILCDTNNVSLAHLDTIRRALESLPE